MLEKSSLKISYSELIFFLAVADQKGKKGGWAHASKGWVWQYTFGIQHSCGGEAVEHTSFSLAWVTYIVRWGRRQRDRKFPATTHVDQ